jgi:hypothetical protein
MARAENPRKGWPKSALRVAASAQFAASLPAFLHCGELAPVVFV